MEMIIIGLILIMVTLPGGYVAVFKLGYDLGKEIGKRK